MLEDSVKTIRNGEIVQGTVIDVKEDEIILNIGYKADGIITKNEYSNDASLVLTDAVHVGDTMEAKVLKVNDGEGQVTLTYKRLAAEKGNKRLEEAFENQEVLKAPVTQVLDGGLCVNVDEARVFIPASLVSDTYEKDLSKYQGQEIEAPYFAVSAEKTRGTELPYLKSAESIWDITSEDFLKVEFYDAGELVDTCNQAFPEAGLTAEDWVNTLVVTEREESGYVKTIQVGNSSVSGEEFRKAFSLNSACFYIREIDGRVRIVTKGLGHGYGLSIYGANEMAKEGKTYQEILSYYYSGIEITKK